MVNSVAFVYPTRMLGGTELLFLRVAQQLAASSQLRVAVVDYPDGFIAQKLTDPKVELIPFCNQTNLSGFSHIVTPPTLLPLLDNHIITDNDARLLLWCLHPFNFLELFPGSSHTIRWPIERIKQALYLYNLEYLRFKHKVHQLVEAQGIAFMDEENWQVNKYLFDLKHNPKYLPVPIFSNHAEGQIVALNPSKDSLNIVWLGRLANFKVTALNHIITVADQYAKDTLTAVTIHIIGSGPFAAQLINPKQAKLKLVGTLQSNELHSYLRDHTSILFAMGTSALEGAQLGIPTVLVDASYTPFPAGYRFNWLYQTSNFTLGRIVSLMKQTQFKGHSFTEIVEAYYQNPSQVSQFSRTYVQNHHALDIVCDQLLEHLRQTKAKVHWRVLGPFANSVVQTKQIISNLRGKTTD